MFLFFVVLFFFVIFKFSCIYGFRGLSCCDRCSSKVMGVLTSGSYKSTAVWCALCWCYLAEGGYKVLSSDTEGDYRCRVVLCVLHCCNLNSWSLVMLIIAHSRVLTKPHLPLCASLCFTSPAKTCRVVLETNVAAQAKGRSSDVRLPFI